MSVQKIFSGYPNFNLRSLPWLQKEVDELKSLNDKEYTVQRDGKIRELEHKIEILKAETSNAMSESQYKPFLLDDGRWLYQDSVYEVKGGHSIDEKLLLFLEFDDKERRKFERLKNKFSGGKSDELKYERARIPEEVRIAVWRRDQGRCARCGNRENLEYDHIVPVTKGGGNTERNIELLCQDCNRAKGNRIE